MDKTSKILSEQRMRGIRATLGIKDGSWGYYATYPDGKEESRYGYTSREDAAMGIIKNKERRERNE